MEIIESNQTFGCKTPLTDKIKNVKRGELSIILAPNRQRLDKIHHSLGSWVNGNLYKCIATSNNEGSILSFRGIVSKYNNRVKIHVFIDGLQNMKKELIVYICNNTNMFVQVIATV